VHDAASLRSHLRPAKAPHHLCGSDSRRRRSGKARGRVSCVWGVPPDRRGDPHARHSPARFPAPPSSRVGSTKVMRRLLPSRPSTSSSSSLRSSKAGEPNATLTSLIVRARRDAASLLIAVATHTQDTLPRAFPLLLLLESDPQRRLARSRYVPFASISGSRGHEASNRPLMHRERILVVRRCTMRRPS
jgi:hypothetical protein